MINARWFTTATPPQAQALNDNKPNHTNTKTSFWQRFTDPKRIEAPSGFNRWLMVIPAVTTHLCLGSVYAWSLMNDPLTRLDGVVASAATDWTLGSVVPVFSTILAMHGISAALTGKWQERVGPRVAGLVGAACFGGGVTLGAVGLLCGQLPLLYAGYGLLAGTGIGLAYVPPVATLLRWFPDRRGMATGLTIMGFGGGALVATPMKAWLLSHFSKPPTFAGSVADVESGALTLITDDAGRRFVDIGGTMSEVVQATSADILRSGFTHLSDGFYVVGSGSTGAGAALACLGLTYLTAMTASALAMRTPPPAYSPAVAAATATATAEGKPKASLVASANVHVDTAMRTPQFWQVWVTFGCLATAGLSVVSVAKTMMVDIFGQALPMVTATGFAFTFVAALSAANLGGRLIWASASDYIGRQRTFAMFAGLSLPLYAFAIPWCVSEVSSNPSVLPLAVFYGSTLLIFSVFGGAYATVPAYEADLFGSKYVGAIHGRMLTASSAAAVGGPVALTYQRRSVEVDAIRDLSTKVDEHTFQETFGMPPSQVDSLIDAKTITINKLMQIVPDGTIDPTPFLYTPTMYTAAGLLAVALAVNASIKPVDAKYHIIDETLVAPPPTPEHLMSDKQLLARDAKALLNGADPATVAVQIVDNKKQ
jgi:MFS family permease